MKRIYTFLPIVLFMVATVILVSCQWGKKRLPPKGKNIVCVVDFSDSRNAAQRLAFYGKVIKDNIIPQLGLYDKITVIPLDKASLTNSTDILFKDFSVLNFLPEQASPMEEQQIIDENLKKYKTSLSEEFEKNFNQSIEKRSEVAQATDIFGVMDVVKGKMSVTDDNYIIFLSDMMNYSDALNMEPSNAQFNNSRLDLILDNVPSCDLLNATVLVITGEQVEVSTDHYNLVKSFWEKYLSKNNVKLFDYNSASVYKLNQLMSIEPTE